MSESLSQHSTNLPEGRSPDPVSRPSAVAVRLMPCRLTSRTARAQSGCGMRRPPCRRSLQA